MIGIGNGFQIAGIVEQKADGMIRAALHFIHRVEKRIRSVYDVAGRTVENLAVTI